MTKKLPKRGLPPMHPGELLREEILPALNRSKTEIARLLGVSRQTLYDILDEKQPVTPGMALRLGLRLQPGHRIARDRPSVKAQNRYSRVNYSALSPVATIRSPHFL